MKNLDTIADQSDNRSATQKHDVNLRKNSTLYFQVGLILCLLGVYALFEMNFETDSIAYEPLKMQELKEQAFNVNFVIEPAKEEPKDLKQATVDNNQKLEIVEDNMPNVLISEFTSPEPIPNPAPISSIESPIKITDEIEAPFNMLNVEKVPVYPGCETSKNNEERRRCMSDKITQLIQKKFDADADNGYGLSGVKKLLFNLQLSKMVVLPI